MFALVAQDTFVLTSGTQARADWRALFSAALIGSGLGLGLGAFYMAGGMSHVATDHSRAARIAEAAGGGFSETMLQRETQSMDFAALRLARIHDGLAGARAQRDAVPAWSGPPAADDVGPTPGHAALNSARDLDCLTQAVYFEARGESQRGQAAVAQVVLNRVRHPAFPKTVCGVVFQGAATHGCQFSFACDGSTGQQRERDAWDRARTVAGRALSGVVLADVGQATHFHTTGVSPLWGPQMLRVAQVGLHIFYRVNPHAPAVRSGPGPDNRAVFVSLPISPASSLRLASAVVEKAAIITSTAVGGSPPAAPAEPKVSAVKLAPAPEPVKAAQAADITAS
ncbi:cell wall hydrolase [Phenylobacterium sp.]|uniref:cell wall hydrolase n=1 Tax=Phenylobacterium sp. TaxID=1871053 RepID=UPI00286A4D2E|nr:cell wall hydrolase [Phenylobacterium sp.]